MTLYLLYASDAGKTANYFCTVCLFFIITNSIVTTKKRLYQTFFYQGKGKKLGSSVIDNCFCKENTRYDRIQ